MPSVVNDRLLGGSDIGVYISPQTTKGAINATPAFTPVRRSTGKAKVTIGYTQDDSVTTDNQGVQNIQDTSDYGAEISASFSKQSVDLVIQAIHGTEVAFTDTDTNYAAGAGGFTLDASAYAALSVRDVFFISGFADDTIDGAYIVASKDGGNAITTTVAPAATEASGASVTFTMNKTTNGLTPTYNAIQNRITDTSAGDDINYRTIYDAVIDSMTAEIGETGIVTGNATFVAEKLVAGSLAISGQTTSAAPSDRSVSAVENIAAWYLDGLDYTCTQKSMTFEFSNGYSGDDAAGCAKQYTRGQFGVSGSASMRARTSNPVEWRDYYEGSVRKEIGVLINHPGGGSTFFMVYQAAITEHEQADGNNDVSNHEVSFAAEGNAIAGATFAVFRNWV